MLFYVCLTVTTKKKISSRYTKIKRKKSKHTTTKKLSNHKGRWLERKKGTKELQNIQKTTNKMAIVSPYLPLIALRIYGLNSPIKRHTVTDWGKKPPLDPTICFLQETHFCFKEKHQLKVKGWKKILHVNGNQKGARVAIFISDKIAFKSKTVTRDKEGHYIMIKGSIQQEDTKL